MLLRTLLKIFGHNLKQKFYSNGKLLLTGEYMVLDGAIALAIPTKFGQSLTVEKLEEPKINWKSIDENGKVWFDDEFEVSSLNSPKNPVRTQKKHAVSKRIVSILNAAKILNPEFLTISNGYRVTTKLDFPINWGLGSSSTLLNNIASWAKVDPYKLLEINNGGSGYDIAAAQNDSPILFSIINGISVTKGIKLPWGFTKQLFFVHLNKKQSSKEGIVQYKLKPKSQLAVSEISDITLKICSCRSLKGFEELITKHEQIISQIIKQDPVKEILFKNYKGSIKSLGAWGGDFILVTGEKEDWNYFRKKGYQTILSFEEMKL